MTTTVAGGATEFPRRRDPATRRCRSVPELAEIVGGCGYGRRIAGSSRPTSRRSIPMSTVVHLGSVTMEPTVETGTRGQSASASFTRPPWTSRSWRVPAHQETTPCRGQHLEDLGPDVAALPRRRPPGNARTPEPPHPRSSGAVDPSPGASDSRWCASPVDEGLHDEPRVVCEPPTTPGRLPVTSGWPPTITTRPGHVATPADRLQESCPRLTDYP
jgi:hypothetical protein